MLRINATLAVAEHEMQIRAIRAQGPGGQNVNKVASAVQLRFDVRGSSLPVHLKDRLLTLRDNRLTKDGVIIIKAQQSRSQEQNKAAARARLAELISHVGLVRKQRKATKPSRRAHTKRLDTKVKHGRLKSLRGRVDERD